MSKNCSKDFQVSPALPSCKSSAQFKRLNSLNNGNMKYMERQIDGPCRKLEAEIWSSPSQFGCWGTLNYSFEDKGGSWKFLLNFTGNYWAKWHIAQSQTRKESFVKFPQQEYFIYQYLFNNFPPHISHSNFFIKTKLLMFYSVVMAAIVAFAKLWKSLLAFVMSVRMEHLGP